MKKNSSVFCGSDIMCAVCGRSGDEIKKDRIRTLTRVRCKTYCLETLNNSQDKKTNKQIFVGKK